jgi:hypothetical protein
MDSGGIGSKEQKQLLRKTVKIVLHWILYYPRYAGNRRNSFPPIIVKIGHPLYSLLTV